MQKVGSVSDLLASMKLLCMNMWPKDVEAVDALRLDVALRMLKSPHFNAKMNSLKEVSINLVFLFLADPKPMFFLCYQQNLLENI